MEYCTFMGYDANGEQTAGTAYPMTTEGCQKLAIPYERWVRLCWVVGGLCEIDADICVAGAFSEEFMDGDAVVARFYGVIDGDGFRCGLRPFDIADSVEWCRRGEEDGDAWRRTAGLEELWRPLDLVD